MNNPFAWSPGSTDSREVSRLILQARAEIEKDGMIRLDTAAFLNEHGINLEALQKLLRFDLSEHNWD